MTRTRTISVTGTGTASVQPDLMRLTFVLAAKHAQYSDMMQQADGQLAALQQALQGCGIAPEALKTADYQVTTEYSHQPDEHGNYRQVFEGYQCRHVLVIESAPDPARLSALLNAADQSGTAPELHIAFTVKDRYAAQAAALKAAAQQARNSAEALAEASGVRLGRLLSVTNRCSPEMPLSPTNFTMMRAKTADMGAAAAITPEDIRTEETATFVWELLPVQDDL